MTTRPRWRQAAQFVLVAIITAVPSYAALSAAGVQADRPGPSTDATIQRLAEGNVPALSAAEGKAATERAINGVARLSLNGVSVGKTTVMPWIGHDGRKLGAVAEIHFAAPVSGRVDLPTFDYIADREQRAGPRQEYDVYLTPATFKSLTGVYVHVDLRSGEVVGIMPLPDSQLE